MRRKIKMEQSDKQLQDQLRDVIPLLEAQLLFARIHVLGRQSVMMWENIENDPLLKTADQKQLALDYALEEMDILEDRRWDEMVDAPFKRYERIKAFVEEKAALLKGDLGDVMDDLYQLSRDLPYNPIGRKAEKKELELQRLMT